MRRVAFVLIPVFLILACGIAEAQIKEEVKLGDLKLTIESIEIKTGLDIVTKEKKDSSFPPFHPGMFGGELDDTRLAYIDWLDFTKSYIVIKFSLANEGEGDPLYVSPTVRFDGVLKAADDSGKIVKQGRIYPESRPEFCPKPGVNRIAKGKKVEDLFIIQVPAKEAKKVLVEVFGWTVLPEVGGTLKLEVPMDAGKLAFAGKVKLEYEPEQQKKSKLGRKGKVKFGRVQVEIVDICRKNLNVLDNEAKMVFTILEERTVIKLKLKNSGSKPVQYKPVLLQEALPGIAIDHQGKWCGMVGIAREVKLVECFDLKEAIPAKGEITDYVVLNPPAGAESIRLVLIADQLFPKTSGIMIFRIKFKDGNPSEIKSAVMKKSVSVNEKSLVKMLEEGGKASEEAWDKKYSGLLVNGSGTVESCEYYEEDHLTVLIVSVTENSVSQTTYGYTLLLPGDHRSYRAKDKISFKAVLLSHEAQPGEWTNRQLVVYGVKHVKARK